MGYTMIDTKRKGLEKEIKDVLEVKTVMGEEIILSYLIPSSRITGVVILGYLGR